MASRVNLRLGAGQEFKDISLPNPDATLAEFLDAALKELEVRLQERHV